MSQSILPTELLQDLNAHGELSEGLFNFESIIQINPGARNEWAKSPNPLVKARLFSFYSINRTVASLLITNEELEILLHEQEASIGPVPVIKKGDPWWGKAEIQMGRVHKGFYDLMGLRDKPFIVRRETSNNAEREERREINNLVQLHLPQGGITRYPELPGMEPPISFIAFSPYNLQVNLATRAKNPLVATVHAWSYSH